MYQTPKLRLALGLGDQELEQRLRPALDAADDLVVVAQCLAADQLRQAIESGQVDAAIVSWGLHRLTDAVLEQLDRPGLIMVLLAPDPDDERWRLRRGPVLPVDTDAATVRQVVLAARDGGRVFVRPRPAPEPITLKPADSADLPLARVIAVTGGRGSPGRTTVAINLAAALGAAAPTVLLEADLCTPAVAAYLDRDPTRNVCTLAHAVRDNPHAWSAALADELQPLSHHSPSAVVLCGPPKPEMRATIAPAFLERLIAELRQRYQYVVIDVGPELLGIDAAAANHRAALASAQQILMVTAPDMVGLWHARTGLDHLERQLSIQPHTVSLLINRYDPRYHHAQSEVQWHLGTPVAATVPFDHHGIQRAVAQQRPLVVDPNSRASRALLSVAERIFDGQLHVVPPEPVRRANGTSWWRNLLRRRRPVVSKPRTREPERLPVALARERRGRAW